MTCPAISGGHDGPAAHHREYVPGILSVVETSAGAAVTLRTSILALGLTLASPLGRAAGASGAEPSQDPGARGGVARQRRVAGVDSFSVNSSTYPVATLTTHDKGGTCRS